MTAPEEVLNELRKNYPAYTHWQEYKRDKADAAKLDAGKLRYDLVPPLWFQLMAEVFTKGLEKYSEGSWREVPRGKDRYYAALMRHLVAHRKGWVNDEESGLPVLAHVAWNALALLEFQGLED